MYGFSYHRPASLRDARRILEDSEEAKLLAGGMTLLPTMKLRLAGPSDLVDLGAIDGLRKIRDAAAEIEIGALACHDDVAAHRDVRASLPALAELAGMIGDPQVRNRGTLGGSLANSDPSADYPAAALALGATVVTDRREIAAQDYFTGMFETALEPSEIIRAVRFPKVRRAAYAKFRNPASRYAVVGVMVAETGSGMRVAVTGAAAMVFRARSFEEALDRKLSPEALDGLAVEKEDLNDDLHATPEYRAHLVHVMAKRAVRAVLAQNA